MTFGSVFGRTFSPTFQPSSQAVVSSNAWTPTDISDLFLWYDFSDADNMFTDTGGTTKVSADGQTLMRINDKSGNDYYATASTSGREPTYKTNIRNGLSASLTGSDHMLIQATFDTGATDNTAFIAMDASTTGSVYFGFNNTNYFMSCFGGYFSYPGPGHIVANQIAPADTNAHIISGRGTSTSREGWVDDTLGLDSTANSQFTYSSPAYIFGGNTGLFFNGYTFEMIIYTRAISDNEYLSVMNYLNNKWAIY